ncbi:transcription factor IIIA [Drosophila pseudoobscura]|uniref:Transcription factor IIIA n=1 Tax=Drosophila pseudoobscura pseudoobscura TaxID=46245 RepID=A0A6I8UHR2_DROPS|nr:transcription factor IIIA [Drosophila pseudoobscura]
MRPDLNITSDSDLEAVLEEFKQKVERRNSAGSAKYTCSIENCGATFKRLDHLDRHEFHHTGKKKHACTYEGCDKTYSIVTHLKRHLRSTHERTEDAAQKNVKCSVLECKKMFTSDSNMQRHVREAHDSPRVYPCGYCPAKFSQKLKLKRHEIREHTKDYPYRCSKCSRGFYQEWQRESHQGSCKLYSCPGCDLQFDKWTIYTKHCRDTLHRRQRNKCEHCESSYAKPSDLRLHMEAKHKDSVGAFACTEEGCSRTYSYERNLRQHQLAAHTGRRFECQAINCGRCFSSAQNLSKHLARDHTDGKEKVEKEKPKSNSKTRKRRRDAGRTKHSRLSKLACLQLEKDVDEEVRQRRSPALKKVAEYLGEEDPLQQLISATLQDEDAVA